MSKYADYTDEEQRLLRGSLQAAAVAISAASPGRCEETVSEGFAAAELILGSQPDYVGNVLVTSILVELQNRLQGDHVFPDYLEAATEPGALDEAMVTLGRVAALLEAKSDPIEATGYKRWLLSIAQATAEAGKEDQGFLGMGGVAVNEAEHVALERITDVLGMPTDS